MATPPVSERDVVATGGPHFASQPGRLRLEELGQLSAVVAAVAEEKSHRVDEGDDANDALPAALRGNSVLPATCAAPPTPAPADLAAATAAVLELNLEVARADGLRVAARFLVERLAAHLHVPRVALAWKKPTGSCSLLAISGLPRFDRRSETVTLLQEVANEAASRQADGSWPPLDSMNRHSLLAHRRCAETSNLEAVASFLLRVGFSDDRSVVARRPDADVRSSQECPDVSVRTTSELRIVGVLIVCGSRSSVQDAAHRRFLSTTAKCLAGTLELARRAEGGFVGRCWSSFRRAGARRVLSVAALCVIVLVGILALPQPYRISCRCVVEPMQRRFVVAPQDGLIETSFVQPGDVVRQGQVLARLDGREVRWELAGLEADRRQAQQQRDSNLARGELGKAELARLEVEQLDAKLELLRRRESLLEIVAPLDGVVLSGSVDKLSSAPAKVGQVLFEIAPVDRLRVEVATPAEDYRHVAVGAPVELRFDGRLNELRTGKISRVRPRSEIRDAADVFVADVELDNVEAALRPGQRGLAVVVGQRHPLAWNLFHKAAERLWRFWPW